MGMLPLGVLVIYTADTTVYRFMYHEKWNLARLNLVNLEILKVEFETLFKTG